MRLPVEKEGLEKKLNPGLNPVQCDSKHFVICGRLDFLSTSTIEMFGSFLDII